MSKSTLEAAAAHLRLPATDEILARCVNVAEALIEHEAKKCVDLPDAVRLQAIIEVAAELYHRRNAPNGIKSFGDMDGAPVRVARDALIAARPLLKPYKLVMFA